MVPVSAADLAAYEDAIIRAEQAGDLARAARCKRILRSVKRMAGIK